MVCSAWLILLTSVPAAAQSDSSFANPSWFLTIHSGALLGKKGYGTSATASIMQGMRYKRFHLGVGLGYDGYTEWRTMPLFAGASYDLSKQRKHSFFVQFNTGYSKAWKIITDETTADQSGVGGFFHHPLLGYKVQQGKVTIHFAAGYKSQRLTYIHSPPSWVSLYPSYRTTVQRDLRRISIEMGIGFR